MDIEQILSRINEYEYRLNRQLVKWLEKKLPKIADDWWNELVVDNLSPFQREAVQQKGIHNLDGLDLASVLRVVDRNWYLITNKYFINNRERTHIREMVEVRNRWAHITPQDITRKTVCEDLNTIILTMQGFDAGMQDTKDIERFQMDVEDGVYDLERSSAEQNPQDAAAGPDAVSNESSHDRQGSPDEIQIGSEVELISDPSLRGAVTDIRGMRYYVQINGIIKTFYREQIQAYQKEEKHQDGFSLQQVRAAISAYQIHNPGHSNLYSLNSARIDFVPYQFRPALKIIKSDVPNILIADDVGVGKTIEAGLILKELEARSEAGNNKSSSLSVLVICPKPLIAEHKWKEEMKRFDENFEELDGKGLAQCINDTSRDLYWPENRNKVIIPYSLFNENSVMGSRSSRGGSKRGSIGLMDLDPAPHFDLVIVDEAHTIRNSNTWWYQGVECFCRDAGAVVFMTATPVQNSERDLFTLLHLLRPDIVTDEKIFSVMAEPNVYINKLLRIVRSQSEGWQAEAQEEIHHILRTQYGRNVIQQKPEFEDVVDALQKKSLTRDERVALIRQIEKLHTFHVMINRTRRRDIEDFCVRRTETVDAPFTDKQRNLYDALLEFDSRILKRLHGSENVLFMMCTMMRQAASCIYGLAPFIEDIVKKKMEEVYRDGELYEYDELETFFNKVPEKSLLTLADEVKRLSRDLPDEDPKIEKLLEVIHQKQTEANPRVIIFSSFRHTLHYIARKLKKEGLRVGQIDGSVPDEERYLLRERFLLDHKEPDAVDVMLFSEVGCEGLDYQFCDTMINYDLPWNPMRIEQRIGRIDRRGQKSPVVKIYNMITDGTIDATIYDKCLSKIGVFESSIGDCGEILGDINAQITEIMFDAELTPEEQKMKIEQLADNDVARVQEMRQMESEEKDLYGFDLSGYMIDQDLQKAENAWINPDSIAELVTVYLNDVLGKGEYILGSQENKTLRLRMENRQKLFTSLNSREMDLSNNNVKTWKGYLRSNKANLPITFDAQYANEHREAAFLTSMHPLVQQAAAYESREERFPCTVAIQVSDTDIPKGDYEFLVYAWQYKGIRPDIRLTAVSKDPNIEKEVLGYLQYADEYKPDAGDHTDAWDALDDLHYEKWKKARTEYAEDVRRECNYRRDQLDLSYSRIFKINEEQLEAAKDEKIIAMRQGQLNNNRARYAAKKEEIDNAVREADIITNLLAKGIVHVK